MPTGRVGDQIGDCTMTHDTDEYPPTSRDLTARYQRAAALCSQRHPDLAAARQLLLQCVLADPGNLMFVETWLQVLQRLGPARGWWRSVWYRILFEFAARSADWRRRTRIGLKLLAIRPADRHALCGLGEASLQMGHTDVAVRYWSLASTTHVSDLSVQRRCAESFSRLGLFEQARHCWERVIELARDDRSASEARRGYESVLPPSTTTTDSTPLPSPIDPSDANAVLSLTQSLMCQGHTNAAAQLLQHSIQACPGDTRLRERLEDLNLELARQRLELGRRRAAADPSPSALQLVDDLQADLDRREIDIFGARSRRYPTDHAWKLKLARSLKQMGNYVEACRWLEEIPPDGSTECEVAVELGECRQYQRQFTAALACYEHAARAVSHKPSLNDIERLALYRAGVLALQLHEFGKAAGHLRRLAQDAPDYKDLPRHLDKIDSIRHKDGFSNDPLTP